MILTGIVSQFKGHEIFIILPIKKMDSFWFIDELIKNTAAHLFGSGGKKDKENQ